MKKLSAVLFLCVMQLSAYPVFASEEASLPPVIEGVARNMDFFARPGILRRLDNHLLYDVNRINAELIGVSFISPLGYETKRIYDINTLKVIHTVSSLHSKARREAMRRESISVADAIKLAESIANK